MIYKLNFSTTKQIRLDEYLRKELPLAIGKLEITGEVAVSNSKIRRLILSGSVFVNGKSVLRPAYELRGNSQIFVSFDKDKFFFEKQPDDIKFEVTDSSVLYETDDLIFINKPAFFPVEQTITGNRDNLHDAVVRYLWNRNPDLRNPPYVGIMHRLDRETSGVILFTKNRSANKSISEIFQSHDFIKKYYGVVENKTGGKKLSPGQTFTVEMFMGRVSSKSQTGKWGQVPESKGGQYSKTDFTVLKEVFIEGKNCFLIECNLFTGRTHQIRVHLSSYGFPLLGDELYGGKSAKRIYLHAFQLISKDFSVEAPVQW